MLQRRVGVEVCHIECQVDYSKSCWTLVLRKITCAMTFAWPTTCSAELQADLLSPSLNSVKQDAV